MSQKLSPLPQPTGPTCSGSAHLRTQSYGLAYTYVSRPTLPPPNCCGDALTSLCDCTVQSAFKKVIRVKRGHQGRGLIQQDWRAPGRQLLSPTTCECSSGSHLHARRDAPGPHPALAPRSQPSSFPSVRSKCLQQKPPQLWYPGFTARANSHNFSPLCQGPAWSSVCICFRAFCSCFAPLISSGRPPATLLREASLTPQPNSTTALPATHLPTPARLPFNHSAPFLTFSLGSHL